MRDNEKFNKSISQEFEVTEGAVLASYRSFTSDNEMQDSILGILKKYVRGGSRAKECKRGESESERRGRERK